MSDTVQPDTPNLKKQKTGGESESHKAKKSRQTPPISLIIQVQGDEFDEEQDGKLVLPNIIVDIWASALLRDDRLVHYLGYGETIKAKAKIPIPKHIGAAGLTWVGNYCYICNPTMENTELEGTL